MLFEAKHTHTHMNMEILVAVSDNHRVGTKKLRMSLAIPHRQTVGTHLSALFFKFISCSLQI